MSTVLPPGFVGGFSGLAGFNARGRYNARRSLTRLPFSRSGAELRSYHVPSYSVQSKRKADVRVFLVRRIW
jgi:hypothetical protein